MESSDKNKKMIPHKLPAEVYRALENVVGEEWISQDRAIVETYSKLSLDAEGFLKKHRKNPASIPACVVLPGSTDEVQSIVRIAHRYKVPFVAFTNGQMMSAPTFPVATLSIHLSRMNRVLSIDETNLTAILEPYADYGQLMAEAAKVGLWNGGTPLATTLCKLSSQAAFAGIWQTSKKYGLLDRNITDITLVLPTGEIMRTGSSTVAGVPNLWEHGPGPDLLGVIRASAGTTGIITEITVKLHTWVGGETMPEPEAGRPAIPSFSEERFDHALPPKKHHLYWIEFPDYDSEIQAYREVAHAGIGIGLNAAGVYSAYYCSPTQKLTEKRAKDQFFPPWNLYVIVAGIVSDAQIAYEAKVLRDISEECGGQFLSQDYKPEVLEALAPWNLDCIRNVCGYRMNRRMYAGGSLPSGPPEVAKYHSRVWRESLEKFGETHITDRGGADNTTFVYGIEPSGRYTLSETDIYPDPMDPESLEKCITITLHSAVRNAAERQCTPFGLGGPAEPFVTFFPEQGPNVHLLLRKLRRVFDPHSVCSPGRQVLTEEEMKVFPAHTVDGLNTLRQSFDMKPIKR